jgi:uncharacterized protein (DUF433 family)
MHQKKISLKIQIRKGYKYWKTYALMKKIIIEQKIRHGKPIIEGTRITVEEVIGMLESGMTYKEIQEEYGLTKEDVLAVIRYLASLVRGEQINQIQKT